MRYRLAADKDNHEDYPQTSDSVQGETELVTPTSVEGGHGLNAENNAACCRLMTRLGCVDCKACLDDAYANFRASQDPQSQRTSDWILDVVRKGREAGIKKADLAVCFAFPYLNLNI